MCYDKLGVFYNANGDVPAVVHQYNRFRELEQRIFHRLVPTFAAAPPLPRPSTASPHLRAVAAESGPEAEVGTLPSEASRAAHILREARDGVLGVAELQTQVESLRAAFESRLADMERQLVEMQTRVTQTEARADGRQCEGGRDEEG